MFSMFKSLLTISDLKLIISLVFYLVIFKLAATQMKLQLD